MHLCAMAAVIGLATVSCGQGRPDFDMQPDPTEGDAVAEAGSPGDGSIRVLSDVTAPRPIDARPPSARDAAVDHRDAAKIGRDAGDDAPEESPAVAETDAPHDAIETEAEAGVSLSTCSAVRACVHAGALAPAECLRSAGASARADAEPVLACEAERCSASCTAEISFACDDCLFESCAAALTRCVRHSGCGDGIVAPTEACDDGNADDGDDCTSACTRARCGDGVVFVGHEECDDGNESDTDGCIAGCRLASCGDGHVRAGIEGCDDSNRTSGDGCSSSCQLESCGNGVVDVGEECDDGSADGDGASCLATCRWNRCGDGKVCSGMGCGARGGTVLEECDDANTSNDDACLDTCRSARCGDGEVETGVEGCDDGNDDAFDACGTDCRPAASHLLITEVVTRPSGAEMIEIANMGRFAAILSDYLLSDSHLYYKIATGGFTTASGSDFAARFPEGSVLEPGQYAVVALANASGGTASFEATYGQKPDFELRPTANGASDDLSVPNMTSAQSGSSSIGATASLTDAGEPVVLFFYRDGPLVSDVDYLFFGAPSASNLQVDKTGIVVSGSAYADDTPASSQQPAAAPPDGGSLHRCVYAESGERLTGGNGSTGHDETSENAKEAFAVASTPNQRTPGGPPAHGLCPPAKKEMSSERANGRLAQ
jgi:cysteine-rich repeat protein